MSWENSYDTWKTTTPADKVKTVAYCCHCETDIYQGDDEVYKVEDGYVCDDCFVDYAKEILVIGRGVE
jgi:hypothetical protein